MTNPNAEKVARYYNENPDATLMISDAGARLSSVKVDPNDAYEGINLLRRAGVDLMFWNYPNGDAVFFKVGSVSDKYL